MILALLHWLIYMALIWLIVKSGAEAHPNG